MLFKENLRYLRKINNMSQEDLANKLSVSRQAVSRWETGDTTPDAEVLIKLSELFNVSTDILLKENMNTQINSKYVAYKNNVRICRIVGVFLIAFSFLTILCLGIFSSVFPAYKLFAINGGADELYKANLFTFLDEHNLIWLFSMMIIVLIIGCLLTFSEKLKDITKKAKQKGCCRK